MSEEASVGKTVVKFQGTFDMLDYYKKMHDLIESLGYDIDEDKYKYKENPGPSNDIEIEWTCAKTGDDYTKFKILCKPFMDSAKKVEVQKGTARVKLSKANLELEIRASLITDFEDRWERHPIMKFFKGLFDRYLYKPTYETWQAKIWEEMYTIENEMKAFFGLARFM